MKRFSLFSLSGGFGYRKPNPALPAGRRGLLACLLLSGLIFLPPAFSQTNETLTISTYYPSPYGVYKELRLYPNINPTPCDDSTEGNMYYDDDKNEVMVCRGLLGGWQSMGLWTLDGTSLYPTNTTWNVGIGTTIPAEKLHVNGNIFIGGNWYKGGNLTAANTAISAWAADGGVVVGFSNGQTIGMGRGTVGSGGVGIGITYGATLIGSFHVDPLSPNSVNLWASSNGGNRDLGLGSDGGNIRLSTGIGALSTAKMIIMNGGNVGIGTTTPNSSKGNGGYVDAKDVYLRDTGKWASESGGGSVTSEFSVQVGSPGCGTNCIQSISLGSHKFCFLTRYDFKINDNVGSSNLDDEGSCRLDVSGSAWTLEAFYNEDNIPNVGFMKCGARCVD